MIPTRRHASLSLVASGKKSTVFWTQLLVLVSANEGQIGNWLS